MLLVVYLLGPVLVPFVAAATLAYALHPLVERLAAARVPRALAVSLVIVLACVAVVGLLLLIVPVVTKQIPALREQLPVLIERVNQWLDPMLADWGVDFRLDTAHLRELLARVLGDSSGDLAGTLLSSVRIGGNVALAVLGNVVLIPVVLFYLLIDWPRIVRSSLALLPQHLRGKVESFALEADAVLAQYLRGQLLVMLILAAYYALALRLAGFDLGLPIGIFTGLAIFVPYVGYGLGLVLALVAGVLQFGPGYALAVVAAVYGIGQVVESFFLTPRLVGERIGLHPLAVIFALLAFGQLLGFVGVLVALPASAVAAVGLRRALAHYRGSAYYRAAAS